MRENPTIANLGDPVRRREDLHLITGTGCYVDDVAPPSAVHMHVLRSTIAHGKIENIDISAASSADGIVGILTGSDFQNDDLGHIPCQSVSAFVPPEAWRKSPFPALIFDRVRAVGDPIAIILAESKEQAQDARELIDVSYDPLPGVFSIEDALRPEAPRVHDEAPGNICFNIHFGDQELTREAFSNAHHTVRLMTAQPRLHASPLEVRGCVGDYDRSNGRYKLITSTQNPHNIKRLLSETIFRVPAHSVQVIAGDVGGAFGLKGRLYPEDVLVLWAARKFGRPVRWTEDRSESFLSDFHGRDQVAEGKLALDADGRILALDVTTTHNLGCRLGPATAVSPFQTARMLCGPYRIPAAHVQLQGVFTNTRTTTSYRGAGRPEATFFTERILDQAAGELDLDLVEIRRRNLIEANEMPYQTAISETYDCGDFRGALETALQGASWEDFAQRRWNSQSEGRLRGRGVSCFVEVAGLGNERMEIRFDPTGNASIVAGTFSHGQGHKTIYSQMLSGWLGLPIADITVLQGDTDIVSHGNGTNASRSATMGGSALRQAADKIVDQAKRIAAWKLSTTAEDIGFADGVFAVSGSNRSISLSDVAKASYQPIGYPAELGVGLEAVGYYTASPQNYPNGCHVVEVEIEPETGEICIDLYHAVDDVGTVVNPLLLEGQLYGSVAQGIGQTLLEQVEYDSSGQLVTGTFLDYAMPRADVMPRITSNPFPVPTTTNPLGIKGGAEVGNIAAPPAIVQAIEDALKDFGATEITLPVTSQKIFQIIHGNSQEAGNTK